MDISVDTIADIDFTANGARAIRVEGEMDQALLNRLEPEILALTSESTLPITLFIDSPGGKSTVRERLLNLLSGVRTIGVAGERAASAAADLLSWCDWSIAQPHTKLLYHGTTIPTSEPITAEWATLLFTSLKTSNGKAVASLASKSARRFRFILSALRVTDVDSLKTVLSEKLSANGQKVLSRARAYWDRHSGLLSAFQEEILRSHPATPADFQKAMFNTGFQFEWGHTFDPNASLTRIGENFAFLEICFQQENRCSGKESWEWPFFVALCRALQEEENELTATDALWLGLIDTIRTDIPTR